MIFFGRDFLILIGLDPDISTLAQQYAIAMLPGVFFNFQFEATKRFLYSITVFYPPLVIQTCTAVAHIIVCYLLVVTLNLGAGGSLISFSVTYGLNFLFIYLYADWNNLIHSEAYLFAKENVQDINLYLKYGIPSALVLCLEWWCFEVLNVFGGWIGVEALDATVGMSSFINLLSMIPIGISESAAILVGNCIGANLPWKGVKFAKTNIIMTFSLACFLSVIVFYTW